jgi:hypothetical protein
MGDIIVRKVLINDNGGTAATSSFSFHINSGSSFFFDTDGENAPFTVATGITYTVTEDASTTTGYSVSYDNCSNLTVSSTTPQICTITNNDIAPNTGSIMIRKVSNPEDGTDFAFTFNGSSHITLDDAAVDDNDGVAQQASFNGYPAGNYTIAEATSSDWTLTNVSCGEGVTVVPNLSEGSAVVTLGAGQNLTCTFTNTKNVVTGDDDSTSGDDDDDTTTVTHHGGGSHRQGDDDDSSSNNGEVLGAQTSVVPTGAPNTGFGGMAAEGANAVASVFTLLGTAALAVGKKKF